MAPRGHDASLAAEEVGARGIDSAHRDVRLDHGFDVKGDDIVSHRKYGESVVAQSVNVKHGDSAAVVVEVDPWHVPLRVPEQVTFLLLDERRVRDAGARPSSLLVVQLSQLQRVDASEGFAVLEL